MEIILAGAPPVGREEEGSRLGAPVAVAPGIPGGMGRPARNVGIGRERPGRVAAQARRGASTRRHTSSSAVLTHLAVLTLEGRRVQVREAALRGRSPWLI